ncbi:MAG: hypothetical protein IPJ77_00245 [Planctomycetes bacterium]|nr:hypothetical protein [Planctomycetota bacterium]
MRTSALTLLALSALAFSTAPAFAQGSDDCATPQLLVGTGTFPYVNAGMTTGAQGQTEFECTHFGDTSMYRDVWFTWTAPATNTYQISSCGLTTFNTKIAVYSGSGCPASPALACNDDFCGIQSALLFPAIAGQVYTVQLASSASSSSGGNGSFSIDVAPPLVPCTTAPGPDVVVGELWNITNYTPAGGIDAFSVGTTGCNIGSAIANWIATNNEHPLVRQNAYRYKVTGGVGRFEQIGLSWLKHTFGAQQDSTCCTCNPGGNFYHLGVGCSDPYDAGTNAAQAIQGPNWEVNAHTGVYPYPFTSPPYAGSVARRLQVALADLEPTSASARFLAEAHYVTRDDAAFGNQNNNATWREVTVSGTTTNRTFSLTGSTNVQQSAIRAWASLEAGVTTTDVQVPGDGLLVIASQATALGGGQWHYEYAVYNMNADRNVGSFSVPIPAGATVSNIGFHDVPYHDGDGIGSVDFSGADWSGTLAGGTLTWACVAENVDPNANALRWGTLYNFRFDANAAPRTAAVSLGLWKGGSPPAMNAAAEVPGDPAFTNFCAGDGSGVPCPCANDGFLGHGCANSVFPDGATLAASGVASVALDTVALAANSMTGGTCVFFQGSASMAPVAVDDGLGCVTGSVVRLGTKAVASNASSFPQAGDPLVSVRGAIPAAGATRHYQCFYRNAVAAFCPPATSNRTNGVTIVWVP